MSDIKNGLAMMRAAFPPHHIGFLAKGSKQQTQCPANEKTNCKVCGGWHHPKMVHLSYVGHAALTDRLLDCDLYWSWEPLAYDAIGLPAFDADGGLWIKLTVNGVTRLGYGNAVESEFKEVGSRQKEVIGDALRNAAMRFGAALELWHKGDLRLDDDPLKNGAIEVKVITESQAADLDALLEEVGGDKKAFMGYFKIASLRELPASEYGKAVAMVNAKRDKKPKAAA